MKQSRTANAQHHHVRANGARPGVTMGFRSLMLACTSLLTGLLLLSLPTFAQDRSQEDRDGRSRDSRDERDRYRDRDGRGGSRDTSGSSRRESGTAVEFTDRYFLIVERNIFVRDRSGLRASFSRPAETQPAVSSPRKPEQFLILTGLALEEDRHVAFIENTATGTTQRITSGSAIASGTITRIEIDHLEYEVEGRRIRVDIGRNFLGDSAYAASLSSTPAPAEPATMPADLAKLDPNDPNLSLVDKMRLRRFQEQQKK